MQQNELQPSTVVRLLKYQEPEPEHFPPALFRLLASQRRSIIARGLW